MQPDADSNRKGEMVSSRIPARHPICVRETSRSVHRNFRAEGSSLDVHIPFTHLGIKNKICKLKQMGWKRCGGIRMKER